VFGNGAEAPRPTELDPGKRRHAGEGVILGGETCGLGGGERSASGLAGGRLGGGYWSAVAWPAAGLAGVGCGRGERVGKNNTFLIYIYFCFNWADM
jgi:hypothetical protein